jgi:copper ion binding protein
MTIQTFAVAGMTCDHCVRAVSDEVGKLPGVERVEVVLTTGRLTVAADRPLDEAEIAAAIDEAGYELVRSR